MPNKSPFQQVHQIFDFPVFIKSFLTLEEDKDVGIRQYHQDGSELRNAIVFDIYMYWFINYVSSISLNWISGMGVFEQEWQMESSC